jgi:hypothetical protein
MTGRKLRLMTLIDEFTRSPPSLVRASVAVCARALCRGTLRLPNLRATGPRCAGVATT